MTLGQRRHLHRVIRNEGWLDKILLGIFSKNRINQLALAPARLNLNIKLLAGLAELCFIHTLHINAGILLNCLKDRQTTVSTAEIHLILSNLHLGGAVDCGSHLAKHLLHKLHHPDIVLVGDIYLHTGKLRIVGLVHTLVAEVLRELVNARESTHNQPLQIELVGNAQVKRDVESIVMGNERTGCCASRDALKDRSLHLKASGLVEVLAHCRDNLCPLHEYILNLRIDNKVNIPLTVTKLRVCKGIENLTVHLLNDRKHAKGLAQKGEFLGVDAELSCLGEESKALDTYYISYIKKFLPYRIVHSLVFARADFIPLDIYLNASCLVLELSE